MNILQKLFGFEGKRTTPSQRFQEEKFSDQGFGFHYCLQCGDYNAGSFLNCPVCGNPTYVFHDFKIGNGLLSYEEWLELKTYVLPDTTHIEFIFEGKIAHRSKPLLLTLEKAQEHNWQTVVASESIEIQADGGAIARWTISLDDLGRQDFLVLRFKLRNATVRGVSLSYWRPKDK